MLKLAHTYKDKLQIAYKYGGSIVGTKKASTKLIDGKYYNVKMYEIFKSDFDKH